MSRVLVVDDEPRYREHISRALVRDGHEVRTAGSGREAIAAGTRFQPDVLVIDWMLKDQLHGLHVSEALAMVLPHLVTVLITGFPTGDLRASAQHLRVSAFLEKPFEMARLRETVRAALPPEPPHPALFAVLDVDADGTIRHLNDRARELLECCNGGALTGNLWPKLGLVADTIAQAGHTWVAATPSRAAQAPWHVRAKAHADGDGCLVVIIPDTQQHHRQHPIAHMLLNLEPAAFLPWPFEGRALIVDDDQWVRHVVARQIECGGGICHTAESAEVALRTCERDAGIRIVVIDYDLPGTDIADFTHRLRDILPGAQIVGTSVYDRGTDFERLGVATHLVKPWTVADLVDALRGRLGKCRGCGLRLPLRYAQAAETPANWQCARCGSRYSALLDDEADEHLRPNAQFCD